MDNKVGSRVNRWTGQAVGKKGVGSGQNVKWTHLHCCVMSSVATLSYELQATTFFTEAL